jgi:hypothetical protein
MVERAGQIECQRRPDESERLCCTMNGLVESVMCRPQAPSIQGPLVVVAEMVKESEPTNETRWTRREMGGLDPTKSTPQDTPRGKADRSAIIYQQRTADTSFRMSIVSCTALVSWVLSKRIPLHCDIDVRRIPRDLKSCWLASNTATTPHYSTAVLFQFKISAKYKRHRFGFALPFDFYALTCIRAQG